MNHRIWLCFAPVLFSACLTFTPALKDTGSVRPVSRSEFIEIKGVRQHVSVRGRNRDNPLLLILHGGPGAAMMPLSRNHLSPLEEHFVVVNWDQPGAGQTRIPDHAYRLMTHDDFVDTAYFLILHLQKEFGARKVYLLGFDWGGALGLRLAKKYPDYIEKLFCVNLMPDPILAEDAVYRFLKERVTDPEDKGTLAMAGAPSEGWYAGGYESFLDNRKLLLKYGGVVLGRDNLNPLLKEFALAPEYGPAGLWLWRNGITKSLTYFWPRLVLEESLYDDVPELEIPVVFMAGRHDRVAHPALAEEYYRYLQAEKEWIWLENSAHLPHWEESGRFAELIIGLKG